MLLILRPPKLRTNQYVAKDSAAWRTECLKARQSDIHSGLPGDFSHREGTASCVSN